MLTHALGPAALAALVGGATQLTDLRLSSCAHFTDTDALQQLRLARPSLQVLH